MKSWKVVVGLGAACAACCAIPLLGLAGGLAAFGSALWACADEFLPAATVLIAVAAGLAGVWLWRRRPALRRDGCGCTTSRSTGVSHAGQ
jgi:hypothetical protein